MLAWPKMLRYVTRMEKIERICPCCQQVHLVDKVRAEQGKGIYCSRRCMRHTVGRMHKIVAAQPRC